MKPKDLIKFDRQCAGFGCDKDNDCYTCRSCSNNNQELYNACCKYEKEIKEYETFNE